MASTGWCWLSIAWLLKLLVKHSTLVFVYYRVAIGGVLLGLLAAGAIQATGG